MRRVREGHLAFVLVMEVDIDVRNLGAIRVLRVVLLIVKLMVEGGGANI